MSEGDEHHNAGAAEAPSASIVSTTATSPGAHKNASISAGKPPRASASHKPNIFIRFIRAVFGYRKTSLSFFVFLTVVAVLALTGIDNSLEASVSLPTSKHETALLEDSWLDLQKIGAFKHPYGSEGNKYVHDFLESKIVSTVKKAGLPYIEVDNDMNNNNSILFKSYINSVAYYESNNILVRINGTRDDLPALLISSHYDSVPSSFGITDDGVGVASLLGVLNHFTSGKAGQPLRTLVFNFNNNEEAGLYGAYGFLNHPWSKQTKYFINLEGTGQGGKAILFRGTDYGITKEYGSVRYPYASSIFQQAFNGRLIHSETDYKVHFEDGGLRGIDIAFYKPRDIYHTGKDNIRHTSKLATWHMLSSALDFVTKVSSEELDIDQDYLEDIKPKTQYASFASFLNYFFIISLPTLIAFNVAVLVIAPVVSMLLLVVIFGYKQNWRLGFVNSVKFPISLVVSIVAISFVNQINQQFFEFSPNSMPVLIMCMLAVIFLFVNYLILNTINFLFKNYKIIQHDEKLIVTMQISFIYWILLIISTARLANNGVGNDHTGEGFLTVLFILQSAGSVFGLLGWCFKASKRELELELAQSGATQPLLIHSTDEYGAASDDDYEAAQHHHPIGSDDSSLISIDSYTARKKLSLIQKTFSYDWFIQFLILVPIPALIFYNNGWLILDAINKSIQESYKSEELIFKLMEYVAVACVLPFLPFIFKVNRIIVYLLILTFLISFTTLISSSPFDEQNPMKLRFIQTANLTESLTDSYVHVKARSGTGLESILGDMPSVKTSGQKVVCTEPLDGMIDCSYKTDLTPKLVHKSVDFSDYMSVDVLKNSSSNDYPYGLLEGEIKINVKDSSTCQLRFNTGRTKDFPVKTLVVYKDYPVNGTSHPQEVSAESIPEGFSTDKSGNFIYKDLSGMTSFVMNKLDNDKPFHVGFQWLPNLIDDYDGQALTNTLKLDVECFWSNLGEDNSLVPSYQELNHYSPLYVSWANANAAGMVSVSTALEI